MSCEIQYIICRGTFRPAARHAANEAEKFIAILPALLVSYVKNIRALCVCVRFKIRFECVFFFCFSLLHARSVSLWNSKFFLYWRQIILLFCLISSVFAVCFSSAVLSIFFCLALYLICYSVLWFVSAATKHFKCVALDRIVMRVIRFDPPTHRHCFA